MSIEQFSDTSVTPAVRGFLHRPTHPSGDGLVLTHGAGSTCQTNLLAALAEVFTLAGFTVLRMNLPFRQLRPSGPPRSGDAAQDREGLRNAINVLRGLGTSRCFLAGHSYGGRQASMLCADEPSIAGGLLLLSYPLHPAKKPEQLRTQHFPRLQTRSLFVHGTRDPLGSISEMESAMTLIPAKTRLMVIEGAGHDLQRKSATSEGPLPDAVLAAFQPFMQ